MRFLRNSLAGVFFSSVALGLFVYAGALIQGALAERAAEGGFSAPVQERAFAVSVVRADAQRAVPVLRAFGEVRAQRSHDVRTAAGGRIIELNPAFVEGGTIRAGATLARIDPADAEAARDRAAADLADAEAEVRDARAGLTLARDELAAAIDQRALQERALARQRDLSARGVGSAAAVEGAELAVSAARQAVLARRQGVTQAEARIALSQTRLTRSQLALSEAGRRLADTVVKAPFAGTLSTVTATEGQLVGASERLAVLIDPAALEVAFRLSTAQYLRLLDAGGVLPERMAQVTLDIGGVDLVSPGRILRESAAVGEAQSGRLIFASLDVPTGFKPGDFVTVAVEEPALANAIRLPAGAYGSDGTVLVLGPENRLEEVAVELLRRQGNEVLVRADALTGRDVVAARSPLLGAGISVRPVPRAQSDAGAQAAHTTAPQADPTLVAISDERRARLIAFVERGPMPESAKQRILARLAEPQVPVRMVERIESRMGG